jgi:predicted ester cyclase
MSVEAHKAVVQRLVTEVLNEGRLEVLDQLCVPEAAARARAWIAPFHATFTDVEMEIVELVAEGDRQAGRFLCSGTHSGVWLGHPPTHRRFHRVPEVYFFGFVANRIRAAWGLEDNQRRLQQLGLAPRPA